MFGARHISVSINCLPDKVYEFASNPENLPKWAAGLSGSIEKIDGEWVAESPMGLVKIKFVEKNNFGILDHFVALPSGKEVYNPMRVFPNSKGSEVVFTLYRHLNMSEKTLVDDAELITKDLKKLKELME